MKFGYLDRHGNVAISPFYGHCGVFYGGVALVKYGGKWGAINCDAKTEIEPTYDSLLDFSDGLSIGKIKEQHFFIDSGGSSSLILAPISHAYPFHEQIALFRSPIGKYGYLSSGGIIRIVPAYDYAGHFSDGLAYARRGEQGLLINAEGAPLVSVPKEWTISEFSQGLAVAEFNDAFGYVKQDGECLTSIEYLEARPFREGLAAVCTDDGWSFLNTEGQISIRLQCDDVDEFSEGLCAVSYADGWHYINKSGAIICGPYDRAGRFSEGFALVRVSDRQVYINRSGVVTIPNEENFQLHGNFSSGLAPFAVES